MTPRTLLPYKCAALNAQVLADRMKGNIFTSYSGSAINDFCLNRDLCSRDESVAFEDRWVTKLKFPEAEYAFLEKCYDIGHWDMNLYSSPGI